MNNIVILDALNLSDYALKEVYKGRSSVDYAVEAALRMPEVTGKAVILRGTGDYRNSFQDFTNVSPEENTAGGLIRLLEEVSAGFDNIIYYAADCPLVDAELAARMYSNHIKYFCEYTFADGYPAGISVEIIKTSILPMLEGLADKADAGESNPAGIERNTIFSLIEKDINAFEIETEISPDDQRLLRVSLFPDSRRNYIQLKSVFEAVMNSRPGRGRAEVVLETIRTRGEFLRSLPVFFEFETTTVHPQNVAYMPSGGGLSNPGGAEMNVEDFRTALEKIKSYSDDAVISLSIRNEPAVHSSPAELAEAVLAHEKFRLLIETSGLGWSQDNIKRLLGMDQGRITWIVDLDALDRELYKQIRGDGYDEACKFAELLLSENPSGTWVQVTRMKENEADNELFYKYWKEKTNNVIIQKYDWCCGRLEQRKVTDLSPVKRLPCWHLKREMTVLSDGRVPLCRDDLEQELICGNLFTDKIEEIRQAGEKIYHQHLKEEYPGICRECDEYYTYNY